MSGPKAGRHSSMNAVGKSWPMSKCVGRGNMVSCTAADGFGCGSGGYGKAPFFLKSSAVIPDKRMARIGGAAPTRPLDRPTPRRVL